jgi:hypothetical protein
MRKAPASNRNDLSHFIHIECPYSSIYLYNTQLNLCFTT